MVTAPALLTAAAVSCWRDALLGDGLLGDGLPCGAGLDEDAARVDLIAALEDLRRAAAALQADLAVDLETSVRDQHAAAGLPRAHRGRGAAAQVALARRESPHRGGVLLGLARALRTDLPHTREALRHGLISEHAATLIARETACLEAGDRREVDEETCADGESLRGVGVRRLVGSVRRRAQQIDPAAAVRRARRAETERRVSLRPAPDAMAYLTALVPMAAGVSAWATLSRDSRSALGTGESGDRTQAQMMADLLLERLTGRSTALGVPVEVSVVMSDASLFGAGTEPAVTTGHGVGDAAADLVVPAQVARELAARASDLGEAWVRRLYARPDGELVAMTSRQRLVTGALRDFLACRDQGTCRTPWCDAPVRHGDHVVPSAQGGPTTAHDTQGLCEACNLAKEAPGWRSRVRAGPGRHTVETVTPTGHHHLSTAPEPPTPAARPRSGFDLALDRVLSRAWPSRSTSS